VSSLRVSLLRAASAFGLLAVFFACVGTIGSAGIAKLFFFLCLVMFMVLLTFAIIVGQRRG